MSATFRVLSLLALLTLLAGCAPAAAPQPTPASALGPFELTIVHSNDTWGYLLPCG